MRTQPAGEPFTSRARGCSAAAAAAAADGFFSHTIKRRSSPEDREAIGKHRGELLSRDSTRGERICTYDGLDRSPSLYATHARVIARMHTHARA